MKEWEIGSLPLVAETVISLAACSWTEKIDPKVTAVQMVMTPDPLTCGPEDDVDSYAEIIGGVPGAPRAQW